MDDFLAEHPIPHDASPASFRDPAGRVFYEDGVAKRLVTPHGRPNYDQAVASGLYQRLWDEEALVTHVEQSEAPDGSKILSPSQISFVSYPYEWCFGELRDAALLTLRIAKIALQCGMTLKDASAFNVQFEGPRPVFIDTLSFERNDGGAWKAYGQFCRHFLAPLMLLSRVTVFLQPFWKHAIDGFPLDVASRLLPRSTYLRPGALIHIHLHARAIRRHSNALRAAPSLPGGPDRKAAILDSLEAVIRRLRPPVERTQWQNYYDRAGHYTASAEAAKKAIVEKVLDHARPSSVTDLGGNVGEYSRLVTRRGIRCVSLDMDPQCVDHNFERAKREDDRFMLPLVMDLTNPSAPLGFAARERMGLTQRPQSELVMALALIHHLRISGGIPFVHIAEFFAELAEQALVEFVPKEDPMVQALLHNREDIFHDYDYTSFLDAFGRFYALEERHPVPETHRTLCLFRRRSA